MMDFWRYHVRYRIARWLINLGLIVWPAGHWKTEVIEMLWQFRRRVDHEIQMRRKLPFGREL